MTGQRFFDYDNEEDCDLSDASNEDDCDTDSDGDDKENKSPNANSAPQAVPKRSCQRMSDDNPDLVRSFIRDAPLLNRVKNSLCVMLSEIKPLYGDIMTLQSFQDFVMQNSSALCDSVSRSAPTAALVSSGRPKSRAGR